MGTKMVGMLRSQAWRTVLLLMVLVLVAAGCASGDEGADGDAAADRELTELGQQLPERIRESGEIKVGSDIAYPPVEFYEDGDENQLRGIDPDLADALGEALGVNFVFENTTFDGLIPALQSERFDIIMSAMSATPERAEAITFLEYFTVGTSILVQEGNPEGIQSLDDLCGKTVALQRGTTQEEVANEQKATCEEQGSTLDVLTFDRDTEALLQIQNGRAAAGMNDFPVAAYTTQTEEGFEVVGEQIDAGPYGIGMRKEDTELHTALQAALQEIIESGAYDEVLVKWEVEQGALKDANLLGA